MKKYELTNETKNYYGRTLYRIKALRDFSDVKAGDLGGFVESEDNLSHKGNAWVFGDAWVCGDAWVYDNARVSGNARVYDNAWVFGDAWVYDNARVSGNAEVLGDAEVFEDAKVLGDARVSGDAIATRLVQTITTHKHKITMTDTHIAIGCENHTIEHWKKNIDKIGKKHNYSEKEIRAVRKLLTGLLMIREENT